MVAPLPGLGAPVGEGKLPQSVPGGPGFGGSPTSGPVLSLRLEQNPESLSLEELELLKQLALDSANRLSTSITGKGDTGSLVLLNNAKKTLNQLDIEFKKRGVDAGISGLDAGISGLEPLSIPARDIFIGQQNIIGQGKIAQDVVNILEETLGRGITEPEINAIQSLFNEGISKGLSPSEIANSIAIPLIQGQSARATQEFSERFQGLLSSQQEQEIMRQELLNNFLSEGGVFDQIALGQLGQTTSIDEARRIAQESRARQMAEEAAITQRFEGERQQLADFTRTEQQKALEESRPFILAQLQRAGIPLQSGALADLFADRATELERARQGFLAGITREDVLSGRDLGQLFSQQSRNLALSEFDRPRSALESLFNTRLGTTREDITGGRNFQQGISSQNIQNLFSSQEASRQRQFDREQQQQMLAYAQQLAAEEARRQKKGSLFGLGGAALGGIVGSFAGPQGALLGAGLGQSLGGSIGGAFGGTAPTGQSPFFNALDVYSRLFPTQTGSTKSTRPTAGVGGAFGGF
jgi:hypothetical protein